ncbi:MAG: type II toxin-antitoxin system VapC family toxin [Dermatophilaceae bacterium]
MALLLDTNALLWLLDGDERFGSSARTAVEAADGLVVSVASLWEIAIKVSLGKLEPVPALPDALTDLGFTRLDIADTHLSVLQSLPFHHRDPFDRLLVSQAMAESMTVLTSDSALARYAVHVIDARR